MTPYRTLLFALGLLSAFPLGSRAGDASSALPEARVVKAAYVYNFTKFVDWVAEDGVTGRLATVTICVVGTDPVGSALDEITKLESKGRPILVRHIQDRERIPVCHILYIGSSEEPHLLRILAQVGSAGVLTVSDIPRFAEQGGMIGFIPERGRVRIEINPVPLRRAGLKVSSKLLEIARIVPEGKS